MADSGHPPAELHERLLICRTIKLNAGAHGSHRRCCHAQMQKNAQNKPQIARLILCVHTTLQVYCNLFLTFCPFCKEGSNRTRKTLLYFVKSCDILKLPSEMAAGTVCKCRWSRSSGEAPVETKIFLLPLTRERKGGCSMTFEQVVLLLTLLGGAIYITFEISWTIFNNKKK